MGFARLARPANLPTAAADILAGIAIALYLQNIDVLDFLTEQIGDVLLLVFSSVALYAGGVVFNDVFDSELDAVERPERAIPSGLVPKREAVYFGTILMISGITLAFKCTMLAGFISVALTIAILAYDGYFKQFGFAGPLNMGICRGLNLLMGMSILGLVSNWYLSLIPVVYIFAITLISRGEVHGNNKKHIVWAGFLYAIVITSMALIVMQQTSQILPIIPFLVLFCYLIYKPLLKAYKENSPKNIKKAVMGGVLSLVVMNACWVAGFSNWYLALAVLLLLPLSVLLSKLFAVT
ncbi:ubiquinone biosynthesis protein UbiA [Maribacter hydrothermalis]|uniref:Ubiquinone biosynthesis protein UbiA n=2 Tax=Maribacter hydrothermalis TaxID=1836467 RepID=A0A1B7ZBT3_9FLAO|nr:ubiquinone biosynthesis protein UbiA [Maribacter hydrothermalis]OBR40156.1 ubiquinone biosynthesis protein UbiA [Maribacter hydrothermalis]